jgi:hypothetical protein
MLFVRIITCFFIFIIVSSCNQNNILKQQVKTLDSLSGVINSAAMALKETDSSNIQALLITYQIYSQFINSNMRDTISKSQAMELKSFYESGEALQVFLKNKSTLLSRLNLLNTQCMRLSDDIRLGEMNSKESTKYFNYETVESIKVIGEVFKQQKIYYSYYQRLLQSISNIENIIKIYNNNQLPTIINP